MTEVLTSATFDNRIATHEARLGTIGLGYAGLPLAMAFAEAGFHVTGIDLNEERVRAVEERRSYLVDVPAERYAGLDDRLHATTDYATVADLDALTICVPTPLAKSRTPDVSFIVGAAESVAGNLRPGQLIVLQSTTHPGTTEEIVKPILESTGAVVGQDVFLGYAPERVDPGNRNWTIKTTPKLVAGVTPECRRRTELMYRQIVDDVIAVSSPTVAETAKLHENTFRAVNIALANELALMCDKLGISVWEVIEAASSKPFAFIPHYPGPGLGGDCIPVVPHFLAARAREYGYSPQLIEAAHEINTRMPGYVVQKVADALNDRAPGRSRARGCSCSGWPTRPTSTTRGSLRASRSCASSSPASATSSTAIPGCPSSSSTAPCTRAWTGRRRRFGGRTASCSSRPTGGSSRSRSGSTRAWSWTAGTSSRRAPASTGSSRSS